MGTFTDVVRRMVGARGEGRLRCAGCGRTKGEVARLVSGPGVYICDVCSADAAVRFAGSPPEGSSAEACSFCGKNAPGIALVAGGRHMICRNCLLLTERIFAEDRARRPAT